MDAHLFKGKRIKSYSKTVLAEQSLHFKLRGKHSTLIFTLNLLEVIEYAFAA